MKETEFYEIIELCENPEAIELPMDLNGVYPSLEDLKCCIQETSLEHLAPVLTFLASDPYKNRDDISIRQDYKEIVKYAREKMLQIPIEPNGE